MSCSHPQCTWDRGLIQAYRTYVWKWTHLWRCMPLLHNWRYTYTQCQHVGTQRNTYTSQPIRGRICVAGVSRACSTIDFGKRIPGGGWVRVPHRAFFLQRCAHAGPRVTLACLRTRFVVNTTRNCIMCFSLPSSRQGFRNVCCCFQKWVCRSGERERERGSKRESRKIPLY